MTILHTLIWNLLAPALVSAASIALGRRIGRGFPGGHRGRWGVAAGLCLGYLAGHVGLLGWPIFPAVEASHWVAWLAVAAGLLGLVEATWTMPARPSWAVRGLFVAGFLAVLLRSKFEYGWTAFESAAWLGSLWVVLLLSWWNLEAQADRLSGPGWVVPLGVVAAGWAVVQAFSGGASFAQLDGVLAATLLGALPTVGLRPGPSLSKGGPPVALSVLAGLGLAGYFYSEVPAASALLLTLAPWAPWVDRIGFVRRRSYWTRAAVRFLAVLLVVGTAVFLVVVPASSRLDTESGIESARLFQDETGRFLVPKPGFLS